MILEVLVTNESPQDHCSLFLNRELLSCVLMLKVVIMKERSVLGYIFLSNFLFGLFHRTRIQNMAACVHKHPVYIYFFVWHKLGTKFYIFK